MIFLKKISKIIILIFLAWNPPFALSNDTVNVSKLRISLIQDGARISIDTDKNPTYEVFSLQNPSRLVVDLANARFSKDFSFPATKGLIDGVRFGSFDGEVSRIVFDLKLPLKNIKTRIRKPSSGKKRMLHIEIENHKDSFTLKNTKDNKKSKKTKSNKRKSKRLVVVIDPGHGGKDPGTSYGPKVSEKDIVLNFSKILKARLERGGYRVYLTRDNDNFIKLKERVEYAKKKGADLFISVHADASQKSSTRGFSVYTLSQSGLDREAEKVAKLENNRSIFSKKALDGVNLRKGRSPIDHYYINKAFERVKISSTEFASVLVSEVSERSKLLKRPQRYAGFAVLKSPNYPSVLVELGFVTNDKDRSNLSNRNWQESVAKKFVDAVNEKFK